MNLTAKDLNLGYFAGKVCTIFTNPINRNFKEDIARQHFVIRIVGISQESIFGTRLDESGLVWFPMSQVISIQEEQEIDPNNPDHLEMIERFEKATGKKLGTDVKFKPDVEQPKKSASFPILGQQPKKVDETQGDSTFIDINSIENLAQRSRKAYDDLKNI